MSWIKKNVTKDVADYLFNIKVSLPDRIGLVQRDLRPDVLIDYDMLEKQLEEAPEMLAFWDLLFAEQKMKVAALQRRSITLRGTIAQRILEDGRAGGYDIRRSDLEDLVEADEEVITVEAQIILEQRNENRLKCVVAVLQNRSEILRSLAGFKKQERSEVRP